MNINNPIISPTAGIVCKAYGVKDRIVTVIYTYTAITTYTLPGILASSNNYIVTPVDYTDLTTIPFDTLIKVKV